MGDKDKGYKVATFMFSDKGYPNMPTLPKISSADTLKK